MDAVVEVGFEPGAVASEHKVRTQRTVTDVVRRVADVLSIRGYMARTGKATTIGRGGVVAGDVIGDAATGRHVMAAEFLESCLGDVVTIEGTERGDYENIAILKASHKTQGDAGFFFEMQARQIRIASSSTVRIPAERVVARAKNDHASAEDLGECPLDDVDDAQGEQDVSYLSEGLSWLNG